MMAIERPKAIRCRTCGQLPADAVPKTYTAAEVGEKIEEDRKRARRDGVNEAIAASEEYISLMGPMMTLPDLIAAIRDATGVKK